MTSSSYRWFLTYTANTIVIVVNLFVARLNCYFTFTTHDLYKQKGTWYARKRVFLKNYYRLPNKDLFHYTVMSQFYICYISTNTVEVLTFCQKALVQF